MTRDEYKRWLNELTKLMPDTGQWIFKRKETSEVWYCEIFKDLEYDVCMSALHQLWMDGVEAYDRERIPARVMKLHGEIRWKRHQDAQKAAERRRNAEGSGTFHGNPVMVRAYTEASKLNHNRHLRSAFVDQFVDGVQDGTAYVDSAAEFERNFREKVG